MYLTGPPHALLTPYAPPTLTASLLRRIMDMSAEQSGRGAAAVHRVDGRIVSKEEYQAANSKKADAKKRQPKFLEEEVEWKRGLAQQRAAEAEAEALKREVRFSVLLCGGSTGLRLCAGPAARGVPA